MRIHEAKLHYHVVQDGPVEALDTPAKVAAYMQDAFEDPTVEWFYVIILNRRNRPLGRVMVSKGTATSALVHPREVFKPVILAGGTGLIVVHNHPGGDTTPSRADIALTRRIREAAGILSIDLLDHLIVGDRDDCPPGWYSFCESGLL